MKQNGKIIDPYLFEMIDETKCILVDVDLVTSKYRLSALFYLQSPSELVKCI